MAQKSSKEQVVCVNRRARFDYLIEESFYHREMPPQRQCAQ